MQIEIKIENEITKKVDVRLWAAQEALLDLWSTGQLSFHRLEREVDAALWNQPHAVSSNSRSHATQAFARMSRLIS